MKWLSACVSLAVDKLGADKMAIIQKDYGTGGGSAVAAKHARSSDKHDLILKITSNEHQRIFQFKVLRNRVEVECQNPADPRKLKKGELSYNDWRDALSPEEKIRVFALILDEYRKHSIGDEYGYRGAVLGVAENGNIFLGVNTATKQITSAYFKECAEQNMVSAASDLEAYRQVKREGWDKFNPPKAPKFKEVYMMGGVDGGNVPVSCPCGKCTDMLANGENMTADGKVFALPILNEKTFDYLNSKGAVVKPVAIDITNAEQHSFDVVRAKVTTAEGAATTELLNPFPVWEVSTKHLNHARTITFENPEFAKAQKAGFKALCNSAFGVDGLLEEKAERARQKSFTKDHINSVNELFTHVKSLTAETFSGLKNSVLDLFLKKEAPIVQQAAANELLARHSIAELDTAIGADGAVDIVAMNRYLIGQIRHAVADRARGRFSNEEILSKPAWVRKHIESIRCVVIQLDDGTFHSAVQASGSFDPSMANAEAAVLEQATGQLGRYGVRHVWAMEMTPVDIQAGKFKTSPKEGIERIVKRASKDGLDFTFIPLNSGNGHYDANVLTDMSKQFDAKEIFPSLFKGSRPVDAAKVTPPQAWTSFVQEMRNKFLTQETALA